MKTINQIRKTDKFCITAGHVKSMYQILQFLDAKNESLVAIANDGDSMCYYTVRVMSKTSLVHLYDAVLSVFADVREISRTTILG